MSDRFLVEADRKPVGVAVRVRGGFRFFCSDETYRKLDGLTFARVRGLLAAVRRVTRAGGERRSDPSSLEPAFL